jgi:hypothetical protein
VTDAPGVHDRPTAAELVAAVREYLENDVMAGTDGRLQFHARVAVNALRMVERELAEGRVMETEHRRRLETVGVMDDAELGERLRAGHLDNRLSEVFDVVYEAVLEKVRVANPGYVEEEGKG